LTGPALAALVADRLGAPIAVATAVGLVVFALPAAWSLPGQEITARTSNWTAGFRVFFRHRALLRVTAISTISYVGIGMTTVCYPLLGAQRLGGASRGALLFAVAAAAAIATNAVLARRPWPLVLAASATLTVFSAPMVVLWRGSGGHGRRAATDGVVRGAPSGGARAPAGAGVHHRSEPEDHGVRRRVRARRSAGRRLAHGCLLAAATVQLLATAA
jgi:hypothetical protein